MSETPALSVEIIAQQLAAAPLCEEINPYPTGILRQPPRTAAVLVSLFWHQRAWQVLYIRRATMNGDMHSGQVAFPGGGQEPQDLSPAETALREAHEEIGLPPNRVEILGTMPRFRTISNYLVAPVVGQIAWPFPVRMSRDEVSRVFHVPLAWLADPAHREVRQRTLPDGRQIPVIYFQPYDGEVIWGATARITVALLETLGL
ncbi:MAG: hypothetical protein Fur0018_28240 [Anaerolineales bacterium]